MNINRLEYQLETIPHKVNECEAKVLTCEEITYKMKKMVEKLEHECRQLDNQKVDQIGFTKWEGKTESRLKFIEETFANLNDKNTSPQNWMDIYMPLRIQHQITETVKESLSVKGKYILGVVDGLMCEEYRARVFTDVGNPKLKEKCLDVIKQLKLEAATLTRDDKKVISDAGVNFDKWNE